MKRLLAFSMLALAAPLLAQETPVTPGSIVAAAPAEDWVAIAPEDLLVMELAPDAEGNPRTVTIQLMPAPFSQGWVGNIRTLAKAHWWDGTNVYRVQDNYVVQWGGGALEKAEPDRLMVVPESEYTVRADSFDEGMRRNMASFIENMEAQEPGGSDGLTNFDAGSVSIFDLPFGFVAMFDHGIPYSYKLEQHFDSSASLIHCYGMVGVARGIDNTGSGSDLYVVIGHAPRQLDRNIAVVGRVIEGIEHLSSLPRGKGDLGFYEDDEAAKRVPIVSVRLMSELLDEENKERGLYIGGSRWPRYEYLSTESDSFAAYVHARANRQDDFYKVPAGGVDICNVPVPVRGFMEQ